MSDPTLSHTPSSAHTIPRQRELRVLFSTGSAAPARIVLRDQPVAIGREVGADGIRLDDRRVSRVHLVVASQGGRWTAVDQGCRNGIFVDGERSRRRRSRPAA